jgi:hypothetical protein
MIQNPIDKDRVASRTAAAGQIVDMSSALIKYLESLTKPADGKFRVVGSQSFVIKESFPTLPQITCKVIHKGI